MNIVIERKMLIGIVLLTFCILAGIIVLASKQKSRFVAEAKIISRNGLHWHPELSIYIGGNKQPIPKDIGLGAIHQPIHTHDETGVIHLEMQGIVTNDQTKLGTFFNIWGKQFNKDCIFDTCNGKDGKVKMLVNGKANMEFEHYVMHDKDKIEIRYE